MCLALSLTGAGNWQLVTGRLDGRFAYIPSPEGLVGLRVFLVEDACSLPDPPKTGRGAAAEAGGGSAAASALAAALATERRLASPRDEAVAGADSAGEFASFTMVRASGKDTQHACSNGAEQRLVVATGASAAGALSHKHKGVKGAAALVVPPRGGSPLACSYPSLLRKLAAAGATAAIIGGPPGGDVTEMHCE